jgi:hypothetical protein
MTKPYHLLTPAEQLAERIARNREISERIPEKPVKEKAAPRGSKKAASADTAAITARQSAVRNHLDQFQKIKNAEGIDAASDFVLSRIKK